MSSSSTLGGERHHFCWLLLRPFQLTYIILQNNFGQAKDPHSEQQDYMNNRTACVIYTLLNMHMSCTLTLKAYFCN